MADKTREEHIKETVDGLIAAGDRFFAGTTSKEELFGLLQLGFMHISEIFAKLNSRGALMPEDYGAYQYATTMIQAIVRTLELDPKYDTEILERQLKQNLRSILKGSPVRDVVQPS